MANPDEPDVRPYGSINNAYEYWRECLECNDHGMVRVTETCPQCDGDGELIIMFNGSPLADECYLCKGSGKHTHEILCPNCKGDGGWWELDVEE
jgi:DnaJ-class molecular chaperone